MKDIVIVKPDKCVGCNVCVRCCPAGEANVTNKLDDGRIIMSVDAAKCVACGECIRKCPHGARDYVDDTELFMSRMNDEKIVVVVDPSIKVSYPRQWTGILEWLKKKGCLLYDAAFGADICTWALSSALESKKMSNIISPSCASVLNYVKLYKPSLMKNLAPVYSPALCSAIYIKNYLRRSNRVAVLSPCIAKKLEYIEAGYVDFNVTFRKIMEYFDKNDIVILSVNPDSYDFSYDDETGQLGSLYTRPGGLMDNIRQRSSTEVSCVATDGAERVYPELDLYSKQSSNKSLPEVYDVLSCQYGCNMGPGVNSGVTAFDVMSNMRAFEADVRGKLTKNKGMFRGGNDDKQFKRFDDELELDFFLRSYRPQSSKGAPTLTELEKIYESMGKHTPTERNFNCGACGFGTCHEMAVAVFKGINTIENCAVYAAASGSSGSAGSAAEDITKECLELSSKLQKNVDKITESMGKIGEAADKTAEKTKNVNDLINNVIAFCNKKTSMNEDNIKQMVMILETTVKSFSAFDDDVKLTKESAEAVSSSVADISKLIDSMNAEINKLKTK